MTMNSKKEEMRLPLFTGFLITILMVKQLLNAGDIDKDIRRILIKMFSDSPADRPELEELIQMIK